jgi:predicted permease
MATVLLVASGLLLRSFDRLRAVDPGFRPDGVMTFRIELPSARYETPAEVARFHYELLDRIDALAPVRAAGATGRLPLTGFSSLADPLRVEGAPSPAEGIPDIVEMRVATPGYFEAVGIPLREGRAFRRSDTDPPSGAVVVSESVARRLLAGRPAIGARVAHGLAGVRGERAWSDVVGVVGDVRGASLEEEPMGAVYYAMVNRPGVNMDWIARSMVYAVRVEGTPASVVPSVRRIARELDPSLPLAEVRTLESVVGAARARTRFATIGLMVAAAVGLFIGALGLYGMLSYLTALRTREIGVRIALGATPGSVRLAVQWTGLAVSVAGLAIGLAGALVLRRLVEPLLYGITPTDPATFAGVAAVLLAVSAVATWIPARRAARLDPVRALRWE